MIQSPNRLVDGTNSGSPSGRLDFRRAAQNILASRYLLIRLFQQATTGSMNECLGRDFQKACGSFNRSLLPKKHANGILPPAVGRMASCVRNVETDAPMN